MKIRALQFLQKNNLRLVVIIMTTLILSGHVCAQQSTKRQPLIAVLNAISNQHQVTFTFADRTIENVMTDGLNLQLPLAQVLNQIEVQTNLTFERISESNIVIYRNYFFDITTTQYLDEVLVKNYLTQGISIKNNGVISVKPKTFGNLPGLIEPDALQIIQSLPGIYSIDERISNLNVRGGTNDQNLMLWDGIKMYQSGHFFGLITAFNSNLIDNVKVIRNGSSVLYGDGVSGVIDMQTSSSIKPELSGGVGLNLLAADSYLNIPIGTKNQIQVAARRSFTDIITATTYDQYFSRIFDNTDVTNQTNSALSKNQRFIFYDAALKFTSKLSERDQINISTIGIFNKLNYDELNTLSDTDEILNSNLSQLNLGASATYDRQWNEHFKTSLQIYLSHYNLDATNFNLNTDQRLLQENQVYDGGLKVHLNYELQKNLNIFGGYQLTEVGISNLQDVSNPAFRRFIKEVVRTHALFGEFTFQSKNKKTLVRSGLRVNYFDKFQEYAIEPRLSLSQQFGDYFRFEVLGEKKSQTTSQIIDLQNDFLGVENRRWVLANDDTIPVLTSKQVAAGLHFKNKELLISAETYIKKVDGITTKSQGFQNQFQFVNAIGSYEVRGLDFIVNQGFDDLSLWLSYSYADNNYTFDTLNNGESFPNNTDITHQFVLAGTYSWNNLKLAVGGNWRTGRPNTLLNSENLIDGELDFASPNSVRLDDYFRLDISANYIFAISRNIAAEAAISVWNVLNTNNTINSYFIKNDDASISQIENESLGVTPNASLKISF